jgi:hypothetical protein
MILSHAQRRGLHGKAALLRHIERTGRTIAGDLVWTRTELDRVRDLYPDYDAMMSALPGRSRGAIAHKAWQLGLVPPLRIWSDGEARALRHPYVTGVAVAALVEMFPGKSRKQIWHKAQHMGYRRPRRAPKPTGMPLIDTIRQRAFDYRLSMRDLDAFVGKKGYFTSSRYLNWRTLQRAMEILGGRPVVSWHPR